MWCFLWDFHSESGTCYVVTASYSYCSPLPPFLSRKETGTTCVCVCVWLSGYTVYVCVSKRTSGLVHIILNRIFPSRVLLPLSFRSLPQDSRFSSKSAASLRTRCLFWSIVVPELQKPWVSIAVTPHVHLPCVAQLLNDWLLLCHLAFPGGIYSSKNNSHKPFIGWRKKHLSLLLVFYSDPLSVGLAQCFHWIYLFLRVFKFCICNEFTCVCTCDSFKGNQ